MKTYTLTTLALATGTALAGFQVGPHAFAANGKSRQQHRALAGRAVLPPIVAGNRSSGFVMKKRAGLAKRKVLGTGDSASFPSNAAKGTFDAAAGCTVWHTVSEGEVCLGLIDKSSAAFTMALFHTYNPALNGDCKNLQVGAAYCVDNAAVTTATDVAVASPPQVAAAVTSGNTGSKSSKADTSPDDDEDCDDDDEADDDEDESDDDETCVDDGEDDDDDEESAAPAAANARKPEPVATKAAPPAPKASPLPAASNNEGNYKGNGNTSNNSNSNDGDKENSISNQNDNGSSNDSSKGSGKGDSDENGSSNNSGPSLDSGLTGQATYYMQNGNKGACGNAAQDSDYVVALYTSTYGSGGNCGKKITITNTANGKTATAVAADMCPGCGGSANNIDLSKGLFEYLSNGNLGLGVLPIKWSIQ